MTDYWASIYASDERLRHLDRLEAGAVFAWLDENLPAAGTAVDWARVIGEHTHWKIEADVGPGRTVSEFLAALPEDDGAVLHDRDSLSPFPVRIKPEELASSLAALLEIPEHHYFLDEQHRWVGVFRAEREVDLFIFPLDSERG